MNTIKAWIEKIKIDIHVSIKDPEQYGIDFASEEIPLNDHSGFWKEWEDKPNKCHWSGELNLSQLSDMMEEFDLTRFDRLMAHQNVTDSGDKLQMTFEIITKSDEDRLKKYCVSEQWEQIELIAFDLRAELIEQFDAALDHAEWEYLDYATVTMEDDDESIEYWNDDDESIECWSTTYPHIWKIYKGLSQELNFSPGTGDLFPNQ